MDKPSQDNWWVKNASNLALAGLFSITIALAIVTMFVALSKTPNQAAAGLLQSLTLVLGVGVSIYAGRRTSIRSAQESIKPLARSAFRRALTLRRASVEIMNTFDQYAVKLDEQKTPGGDVAMLHVAFAFDALKSQVGGQAATIDDAMWDWRDILPEVQDIIDKDQATPPEVGIQ